MNSESLFAPVAVVVDPAGNRRAVAIRTAELSEELLQHRGLRRDNAPGAVPTYLVICTGDDREIERKLQDLRATTGVTHTGRFVQSDWASIRTGDVIQPPFA